MRLKDKVAIVTGAAHGMGEAATRKTLVGPDEARGGAQANRCRAGWDRRHPC
jgi:NAD(P)-dependent dehydrogenase (short-subunit alcohol dehydrogenase family)